MRRTVMVVLLAALGFWQLGEYMFHQYLVLVCGAVVFVVLALNELVRR